MLSLERREEILELMRERKAMTVEELSARFFISGATIRRDLDKMAREGLIKRTYGGALLLEGRGNDMPLLLREGENTSGKERIARAALELIPEGSTLFLDSSSTVSKLVPLLGGLTGLTAVTNSPKTAVTLGGYDRIRTYCTGGLLRGGAVSLIGTAAKDSVANYNADAVFFSCRGISLDKGVTEAAQEEAEIKREMIRCARLKVLLCDKSKFDGVFFSRICALSELSVLITDEDPGLEWREQLERLSVRLIVC